MGGYRTLDGADVSGKRVLVRLDLNVPMKDGRVTDTTRIERSLPTIRELRERGARVILLSHFGRPKGKPNPEMSLQPVADALGAQLGARVGFAPDCAGTPVLEAVTTMQDGDVLVLENTRFHEGEEANDPAFAAALAELGEVFVNDAFSAAHRAHASTEGVARRLPALAGRAMEAELNALEKALTTPERPVLAVVGGAKISTKLDLLSNLISRMDFLVIGGAMANTFLAAAGYDVGKSLCEHDLKATANGISAAAAKAGCEIVLPLDVIVAKDFRTDAEWRAARPEEVRADEMILDIGPLSVDRFEALLADVRTVVWNGPLGAFELEPFAQGTVRAARAVAEATKAGRVISVAGGGDTVAALNTAGVIDDFTYVSTAGGAFLEWLEGKELPGVAALRQTGE
ncbi:MAG: phosphoglycerate kinase [Alphaproteobacteria bacterium]